MADIPKWLPQNQHLVYAGPTSGFAVPAFRAIVLADFPSQAASTLLGRGSAGAGVPEVITLDTSLIMTLTVLAINPLTSLSYFAAPTGDLSIGSHKLTNVTNPGSAQDAATKSYVDTAVVGVASVSITDDTTTNATVYPTWVTAATGSLPVKVSSTKISFNPSTGTLTATAFAGPLTGAVTGNVTGNVSGSSGSCTGNAATATNVAWSGVTSTPTTLAGYGITNGQPLDATLTALAALTIAASSLTIGTGADAFSQTTFAANTFPARASTGDLVAKTITDAALTVLDDTTVAAMVDTLGGASSTGTSGLVRSTAPTFVTSIIAPIVYGSSSSAGTVTIRGNSSAVNGFVYVAGSTKFTFDETNAKLGIAAGTANTPAGSPFEAIDIYKESANAQMNFNTFSATGSNASAINFIRSRGNGGTPAAIQTSDVVALIQGTGVNTTTYAGSICFKILVTAAENFDSTHGGVTTDFQSAALGAGGCVARLTFNSAGLQQLGAGGCADKQSTLTYASPTSVDVTLGNAFKVTTVNATGSVTFNATAGGTAGQWLEFTIVNDATSGKTITWGTNFSSNGTLVGTISKVATIGFKSDGTKWYEKYRTLVLA